ncbi:hypothetical protein BDQ12DRAFT_678401 [Crucibulum laeve]|uniref:Uncharacterized protein n=1 Tax=Crucibulum laeve TaxID=68775 RepID=A0A5C3M8I5_9AGAR|nr:hypothetical protein BDQ12DRAFT_678401 [Crucibulum laeve]
MPVLTRSAAKRVDTRAQCDDDVIMVVSPSATGQGKHIRWFDRDEDFAPLPSAFPMTKAPITAANVPLGSSGSSSNSLFGGSLSSDSSLFSSMSSLSSTSSNGSSHSAEAPQGIFSPSQLAPKRNIVRPIQRSPSGIIIGEQGTRLVLRHPAADAISMKDVQIMNNEREREVFEKQLERIQHERNHGIFGNSNTFKVVKLRAEDTGSDEGMDIDDEESEKRFCAGQAKATDQTTQAVGPYGVWVQAQEKRAQSEFFEQWESRGLRAHPTESVL